MTHSSEEVWALDDGHHGRVGDHTAHRFCTDPVGARDLHVAGAILGYGPTELYPLLRICCESYSATETLLCSVLPLPEVRPGSASNLCQPPTGKVESTLLFGLQL